jgi:hypothetical protein
MFRKRSDPLELVLYTRAGCHLCDVMKEEIARARLSRTCTLREVDIDRDPKLVERYERSVPVLEIDGRAAFKVRCTAEEIVRKVERALREREPAPQEPE